ncbi:unnamed protein product [Wuchereria bancrofti]|nr:unnamed protein product [Wuchereria bancrofti]
MNSDIDVTMNYKESLEDSNCHQTEYLSLLNDEGLGSIELNLSNFQNISIDKPINGSLTIINNSQFEQTINAQIQIDLTSYTGLVITHVYLYEKMLIMQSKQCQKIEFSIPSDYFRNMFMEDWNISITAFAKVSHNNERFYTQQILTLLKPILSIKKLLQKDSIASSVDKEEFQISLANSLNILLTNCEVRIDGTGLTFNDSPILCGSIEAYNTLTITTSAIRKTNLIERKVVAVFNCDQLKNVRAYIISN